MIKKVRMTKSRAKQGIDACVFHVDFRDQPVAQSKHSLINAQGREYGSIEVKGGRGVVSLILPRYLRENNAIPFGVADVRHLKEIMDDCLGQIEQIYGPILRSKLKSIECNITQTVSGKATPSDIMNLINLSNLNSQNDNIKYVGPNKNCALKESNNTVIIKRPHYYVLKAYDKTSQMAKEKSSDAAEPIADGLLRIEIIMIERTLERLFGDKTGIEDILTENSLIKIFKEFKRIFYDEIMDQRIHTYEDKCIKLLIESLFETESPIKTIAVEREIIFDKIVLQKAVKRWQDMRRVSNNSKRDADYYAKNFELSEDVILTLEDFRAACG